MDVSEVAPIIAALASMVTAIAVLIGAIVLARGQRAVAANVEAVHEEVKTVNGITMAALADRAEGRRIETDVPVDQRTDSEAAYVTNLAEGGPDGKGH